MNFSIWEQHLGTPYFQIAVHLHSGAGRVWPSQPKSYVKAAPCCGIVRAASLIETARNESWTLDRLNCVCPTEEETYRWSRASFLKSLSDRKTQLNSTQLAVELR
jgi:hypothetical protein